jgi:DNA polymerase III delta subunit
MYYNKTQCNNWEHGCGRCTQLKKDIPSLKIIYEEIDNIDINDFGLLTILYNNFLNVINIQLGINPTAESLGMKHGQFNAIKYNCGYYSVSQLVNISRLLTDMDRKVKSGEFPTSIMRDYLILSVLSQK